jgi:drug/metabolite transporter (DMT)-like permease
VTAVIGGFGAAIIWAIGSVGASRAAREVGSVLTLAWVMLIGLLLLGGVLPFSGAVSLSGTRLVWLGLAGAGSVGGLLLMYRALRIGYLGVVMPIVTSEGGITAVIAIAAGQSVRPGTGAALAVIVVGVLLTAGSARRTSSAPSAAVTPSGISTHRAAHPTADDARRAAGWASLAALSFGVALYGTGRAGAVLPAAWAVLPPRAVGMVAVTIPLAFTGRLRWPRECAGWLLLSGGCEVGGYFAYAVAARDSIAVAAILSTLAGTIAASIGRLLLGERLGARQLAGVGVIFLGVAAVSALTT